jgi:hypothetical protein
MFTHTHSSWKQVGPGGFLDIEPLATEPVDWDFHHEQCVSCEFRDSLRNAPFEETPDWEVLATQTPRPDSPHNTLCAASLTQHNSSGGAHDHLLHVLGRVRLV